MSDCGLRWTFGALAVVVGAGLVARRGSRGTYEVGVTAWKEASATHYFDIDAMGQEQAERKALEQAREFRGWEFHPISMPPEDFEVFEVESTRRSIRQLPRRQR